MKSHQVIYEDATESILIDASKKSPAKNKRPNGEKSTFATFYFFYFQSS